MKRRRSSKVIELGGEDEGNKSKRLPDISEITNLSDEDDLVMTSGPPPIRHKASPAKRPLTTLPRKDQAPQILLEDDDDDEKWPMPAPAKLPSTEPDPAVSYAAEALRLMRLESMTPQDMSLPEARRKAEDQARIQAQKRPELALPPMVYNIGNSSTDRGKSPLIETEEKNILIEVQNKDGEIQPILILTTDTFEELFKVYADVHGLSLPNVSFRFDGENLDPNSTPRDHCMEESVIIEVYNKI